ncbi:MAG: NUDIX hydrolase [Eubacteriales bacterium]|nr:NUDIX hydrolase [Eubacteriales bacterium]
MEQEKANAALREECVSSRLIFDGRVVQLYVDRVRLPDGREAEREYMRHIGAVCVLPLDRDGVVHCVRQYRYPHGEVLLEIPAGKLDSKTEDRASAALRELQEETGYRCGRLTFLGNIYTSPAILDEVIGLYLAEELTPGETHFDEDEFLAPVAVPLEELADRVMRGEIPDAKTQLAVLRVRELLRRRGEAGL